MCSTRLGFEIEAILWGETISSRLALVNIAFFGWAYNLPPHLWQLPVVYPTTLES